MLDLFEISRLRRANTRTKLPNFAPQIDFREIVTKP